MSKKGEKKFLSMQFVAGCTKAEQYKKVFDAFGIKYNWEDLFGGGSGDILFTFKYDEGLKRKIESLIGLADEKRLVKAINDSREYTIRWQMERLGSFGVATVKEDVDEYIRNHRVNDFNIDSRVTAMTIPFVHDKHYNEKVKAAWKWLEEQCKK